jgi:hypothetical protein
MPNGNAPRDLEWLKRVLRKHFRHSWRRVAVKLEARQSEAPTAASVRTIRR